MDLIGEDPFFRLKEKIYVKTILNRIFRIIKLFRNYVFLMKKNDPRSTKLDRIKDKNQGREVRISIDWKNFINFVLNFKNI